MEFAYLPPLFVVAELVGNSQDLLGVKAVVIPTSLARSSMSSYADTLSKEEACR